jgi:hypothetical protein
MKKYNEARKKLNCAIREIPHEWRDDGGAWLQKRYEEFMYDFRAAAMNYRHDAMDQAEADARKQLIARKQMAYAAGLLVRKCKKASL